MSKRHLADAKMTAHLSISEALAEDQRFSRFHEYIQIAGLDTILAGKGTYTVCAPINEAFAKLPTATLTMMLDDPKGLLFRVLQYHILYGNLSASTIKKLNFPKTRLGITIEITEQNGAVLYGDATVTIPNISCSNGIIHGIDRVAIPNNQGITLPPQQ